MCCVQQITYLKIASKLAQTPSVRTHSLTGLRECISSIFEIEVQIRNAARFFTQDTISMPLSSNIVLLPCYGKDLIKTFQRLIAGSTGSLTLPERCNIGWVNHILSTAYQSLACRMLRRTATGTWHPAWMPESTVTLLLLLMV